MLIFMSPGNLVMSSVCEYATIKLLILASYISSNYFIHILLFVFFYEKVDATVRSQCVRLQVNDAKQYNENPSLVKGKDCLVHPFVRPETLVALSLLRGSIANISLT